VAAPAVERLKITVRGAVQGVGFRPFLYRLAGDLRLAGWVRNSAQGVFIEVEGARPQLEKFLLRIEADKPPHSFIQSLEPTWLDAVGHGEFEIRASDESGPRTTLVLPDIATCPDCLREILDPANRRSRYPFTNCTHCGPRFSIIEALPYDRPNTSMKRFTMCPRCQAEYDDPRDRRFHAQPNACPACGPHLELWDPAGQSLHSQDDALLGAAQGIQEGRIVAVKGLGGFHLMVAAHDDDAVRRLRQLKHREEKPFALMFQSLEGVGAVCEVSDLEARLLRSSEAPIVLVRRRRATQSAPFPSTVSLSVAPSNPYLGVMLPYTPLHHLLLGELRFAVVATSGNLSDEPICTDERDALERLRGIADLFLVHNRPIVRHVDDSIVRVMLGREFVMRRARGYAPLPVTVLRSASSNLPPPPAPLAEGEGRGEGERNLASHKEWTSSATILAVGAHLKNTVALSVGGQAFVSQHIGDLETVESFAAFQSVVADLQKLFEARPGLVAADLHPDYLSTRFARGLGLPLVAVQHHYAHVLACMAENGLEPPVLGVAWDGTGYGTDGTIWGGEFLLVTGEGFERAAHFRTFRLPGADKAVREPRRTAIGLLYELFGEDTFGMTHLPPLHACSAAELGTLRNMLARQLNSPLTSSAGRLFDAVASLVGLRQQTRFEGQAAMELEFAAHGDEQAPAYPFELRGPPTLAPGSAVPNPQSATVVEWAPLVRSILEDLRCDVPTGQIAARFHETLAEIIVAVARRAGVPEVALTGGCFQNQRLTERAVRRLQEEGFRVYWHQRIPPNDGGIALGQVMEAHRQSRQA
jgi:hydrogenase maturation protein HypF